MRHVRMLGLCLVATFAISAMAAVPALAKYSVKTFTQFKNCPYETSNPEVHDCFTGITSGGANGGYFAIGNVKVPLNKPITIQGAFIGECCGLTIVPPDNGAETLESPELTVTGGISLITKQDQTEAGWPQALIESFNEAKKNKETALKVKIEVAGGNELYENPNALSTENLLEEHGNAFELPLKVKMTNPWLSKLGGGPCLVGNDAHPITQNLTSEQPGRAIEPGGFDSGFGFENLELKGSRLIALNWPVEEASGATGCGGATYEAYVDAAINEVLGVKYHRLGTTVLQGNLFTAKLLKVKEAHEKGEF